MESMIGMIAKGRVCGKYIVIAIREIAGEKCYQVKPYCEETGKAGRGEFAFPINDLIFE